MEFSWSDFSFFALIPFIFSFRSPSISFRQITMSEQLFVRCFAKPLPTLSVCWVTSQQSQYVDELCVNFFTFLSTLEAMPPCQIQGQFCFYYHNGHFSFSAWQMHALQWLSSIRPGIPFVYHFINKSFVVPLATRQASRRLCLAAMVRLVLLWGLDSQCILCMDGDLTLKHPFLSRLRSYVIQSQNVSIWAVVDRAAPCFDPGHFPEIYCYLQNATI
jgi:hypothetical protein